MNYYLDIVTIYSGECKVDVVQADSSDDKFIEAAIASKDKDKDKDKDKRKMVKCLMNFFALVPNLTIYKKFIEEFSNTAYSKYVFQCIGEFVHNNPVINEKAIIIRSEIFIEKMTSALT